MKKLLILLALIFTSTISLAAHTTDPGDFVPVTPDTDLLNRFYNLENVNDVSVSLMKFYKDYDKALEYFKQEIDKAPYKSGMDSAGYLSGSFQKVPILKEYLSKYNICSITMRGTIESDKYFNSTVLYIVDPKTKTVSYWMYMN